MYQFCPPKFKFGLFVVDNSKTYFQKNQQNQNVGYAPVICYADTYEINGDGSIVFYQTIKTSDDKKFKVPVLSYPTGKWDACVLLDDANEFPVFKGYARQNIQANAAHSNHSDNTSNTMSSSSEEEYGSQLSDNNTDELSQLNDNFAQSIDNKVYLTSPVQNHQHQTIQPFGHNTGLGMPGITNNNNPQEFKKQKEEWLENEVKQYSKEIDLFTVGEFLTSIAKKPQSKTYKITETDVVWASSKLIRNKAVMSRKFAEPNIQKALSLILPDIMKRQWDGKMAPILQILQEREETKNITAIDLAVWMVQNNY